ncbi:hypothetical protein SAMN05660690_3388 [Geodermatophilus telluris]|uniref:DUF7712 domain-containing protein n=1 Tax=Geodermatophilus telluris TaxID=1190417 RepID=A0A1G6S0E2_9ACTN|nr:hypothetical protein [Geodermatophilus telluris]SDD10124.1 hypothetical protein SAMN05660690_3388 [Geodermatophilus telluris]
MGGTGVLLLRAPDGGMNDLDSCRALTAGGSSRVLAHAAPARLTVRVTADDDTVVARGETDRDGEHSPVTLLELTDGGLRRTEVWPDDGHLGLPVLLPGGEVGVLLRREHAPDRSWWRWVVEFSDHRGRPADWAPEGQRLQR